MGSDDWTKIKALFAGASELPADARDAYLEDACGGDAALRGEVEALLRAADRIATATARPTVPTGLAHDPDPSAAARQPSLEAPGATIGPYKLLQPIGEGGMGTVWLAEQRHPVARQVALKVVKLGMDTRQVIARFEAERQALAIMDHPNIARVIDAGATVTGRPYFVMELVRGVPITEYCDRHQLTVRQRVELLIPICQAIQHAHQKGIIHRDIKPSNVLVALHDGNPVPKVIDFGIAKATNVRLTEKTMFTEHGQMIGTPAYMSPEQVEVSGLDVDTRSDVYSLGVLMYELLTGVTPFDAARLRSAAYHEMQRMIREVEPPRPSTRVSTLDALPSVAARRRTEPTKLTKLIRGELDWIVMRCLEKDRARRYETANALASDLKRYLCDDPITAGPPSATYRLRKMVRRNKVAFAAAAAFVVLLSGAAVVSTWQAVRATRAEHRERQARLDADAEKRQAQAVVTFLTGDVLRGATPERLPDKAVRDAVVRVMLEPAAAAIATQLAGEPLVEAAVRDTLGQCFYLLGRPDLGRPHARRAFELRQRLLGDDHSATLDSVEHLSTTLKALGEPAAAESLARDALSRARARLGDDHAQTLRLLNTLAIVVQDRGRYPEAETLLRDALERRRRTLGADDERTIESHSNLAVLLEAQSRYDEAARAFADVLSARRRLLGDDHPDTMIAISNLGWSLMKLDRLTDAETLLGEAEQRRRRVLGIEHPHTLNSVQKLGALRKQQGKYADAEVQYRAALEGRRRVLGADHPQAIESVDDVATALQLQGRLADAEPLRREALERSTRVHGKEHPATLSRVNNLGWLLRSQERLAEAEPLIRHALDGRRRAQGDDHVETILSMSNLAALLLAMGQTEEAKSLYREALERSSRALGADSSVTLHALHNLGYTLMSTGSLAEAEALLRDCVSARRRKIGEDHVETLVSLHALGEVLEAQGRYADAEAVYRDALARRRRVLLDDHPATLLTLNNLGVVCYAQRKAGDAEPLWLEAIERRRKSLGPNHPHTLRSMNHLARLYLMGGRLTEAEPIVAELYERATRAPLAPQLAAVYVSHYGPLLARLGRHVDAVEPLRVALERLKSSAQERHSQMKVVIEGLIAVADANGDAGAAARWRDELGAWESSTRPATRPTTSATGIR
jgi:serine/threonine protein kinase/Tfp pilus assembly protein PilF